MQGSTDVDAVILFHPRGDDNYILISTLGNHRMSEIKYYYYYKENKYYLHKYQVLGRTSNSSRWTQNKMFYLNHKSNYKVKKVT